MPEWINVERVKFWIWVFMYILGLFRLLMNSGSVNCQFKINQANKAIVIMLACQKMDFFNSLIVAVIVSNWFCHRLKFCVHEIFTGSNESNQDAVSKIFCKNLMKWTLWEWNICVVPEKRESFHKIWRWAKKIWSETFSVVVVALI